MNNYDYLTEHEKIIFGYIEDVPSENEPKYNAWDDEYLEEIDALNDILNIK